MDFQILQIFLLEIKEILFGTVAIEKGINNSVNAILEEDASFFVQKSKSSQIVQNISLAEIAEAPMEKGCILGIITFTLDDEVIKTVNIIAETSVEKLNLFNMTTNLYDNWFNLLR